MSGTADTAGAATATAAGTTAGTADVEAAAAGNQLKVERSSTARAEGTWASTPTSVRALNDSIDTSDDSGDNRPDTPNAAVEAANALLAQHREERESSVETVKTGWGEQMVADYRILFDEIDIDHSGLIDAYELEKVFKTLELRFSRRRIQKMINSVDCTGDGEIDFEEFLTLLFKLHDPKARSWNLTVVFDYTEFAKPCLQQTRADIWEALEDPSSSTFARVWTFTIIAIILLSTVLIVLQSIPAYYADEDGIFFALEFATGVVFSLEFFARALTTPSCKPFVGSFMNWIDLLSIVPFWGDVAILAMNAGLTEGGASVSADDVEFLVVMRAVRVFRILKVSRYVKWVNIFTQALSHSASALLTVLYIIMVMVLVLSAVLFYIENDHWDPLCGGHNHPPVAGRDGGCYLRPDGQPSKFSSIPVCIWWCMITISTIGFGDLIPQTGGGKLLCSFTAVAGVIILAVPISIVSANFRDVFRRFRQRVWLEKRRAQIKQEVTEKTTKKKPGEPSSETSSPAPVSADGQTSAEAVLFATYEQKYQQTLVNMCEKNNRRFGYGLVIEGAASRATLIDSLYLEFQRHEENNDLNHDDVVDRLRARRHASV